MFAPSLSGRRAFAQETTTPNLKIAFIGDQALGPNSVAVLNLIKSEGAQAVLHSGDLDYTDNPGAWEAQINSVLGPDFPYFVTIGNHDELGWRGPIGYQQYLISRFNRLGISWSGDLGVQSTFRYQGLFFVLTAPGITSGFDNGSNDTYIRDQLAADHSVWSIASWHKNMRLMQAGGKPDETGWAVYEEARKGGAIIATAHEHSYSRTHLLSSMINQTIASTASTMTLTKGNSFAFVSGLGGHSVRPQLLSGAWWASISAAPCLSGDPVCQPNGNFGALFGVFNVDGQPNKAFFYFKDISGRIVDSFTVISNSELPIVNSLLPVSAEAGGGAFTLTVNGENFGNASVVRWNGVNRPSTLISPTQLEATISAADISTPGTAAVTVTSPGGISNAVAFIINQLPDLTITKSHVGNFTQGQVGATYSITATNSGFAATSGTVTVIDTLPAGLAATAIGGAGWTCVPVTLTCTRSDVVAAGSSYPVVTVTVTVANNAVANVTNSTTVSGGGQANIANDSAIDPTVIDPRRVIPIIDSLLPVSAEAGGNAFTLTVSGDNFLPSSVVRWNNVNRPTTFFSSKQLTAAITAADIATTGTAFVTVSNPDGASNTGTFTISPPSIRLFTEDNSERAIALDSVTLVRDPFLPSTLNNFSPDRRTRITFFSPNLALMPGDSSANVFAQAEDAQHRLYPLTVEFIGKTPQINWLTQIVIRLPDELTGAGDFRVSVSYRGAVSNKALISLRQQGN